MEAIVVQRAGANKKALSGVVGISSLISFYQNPPNFELQLDEFELLACDRLQLLRGIDALKSRNLDEEDLRHKIEELEKNHILQKKDLYSKNLTEENRDLVSHFILRIAYCRSEDLRRWFLNQECVLFKYRLDKLNDDERANFMLDNGVNFAVVSSEEKFSLQDKLMNLSGVNKDNFMKASFYKVPFQQALTLISTRQVYLQGGLAYVPVQRLVSIITTRFRMAISRALAEAANSFDIIASDHRIGPFLQNMNKQFIGNDFSQSKQVVDKLSPDKVDAAADLHMPLCMKNLNNQLKKEHKLKHWGRLQYGLFLKAAGLDHDAAMQFWESHFTKAMSHDQFVKQYAYNVNHMYGKEGKKADYTPYSCMKIIMNNPPDVQSWHGCPFKHSSDQHLTGLLLHSMKIPLVNNDVKEVTSLAKSSNYQLACQRHFELLHPDYLNMPELKNFDSVANHPNQWYITSVKYHNIKNNKGADLLKVEDSQQSTTATIISSSSANAAGDDFTPMET